MRVDVKGNYLTTKHIWFESFEDVRDIPKTDGIVIHMNEKPEINGLKDGYHSVLFTSLESDLTSEPEEWNVNKYHRQKIRRSMREGTELIFFNAEDVLKNEALLSDFNAAYKGMFAEKGLTNELPVAELEAYAKAGYLTVSKAVTPDGDEVFHSYIHEAERSRPLQSCSLFRGVDNNRRNALGRANVYLTYEDMKYFKNKGVRRFDWGGVSSYSEPNGIDHFKLLFGGLPIEYYSINIESGKAKLLSKIKSLVRHG